MLSKHLRLRAVLPLEGRCEVGKRRGAARLGGGMNGMCCACGAVAVTRGLGRLLPRVARHEDNVAAAPGGFGGEGVADAAGRAGDDCPRPVVGRGSE